MAGLPDIEMADTQPGITFEELREQCEEQLSPSDAKLVGNYLYLRQDCTNLVRLLKDPEAQIDVWGNFSLEQLRDLITSATELNFNVHRYPSFMSIFAREYSYNKDTKGYFPEDEILYQFYNYSIETCPNKFIREWNQLNLKPEHDEIHILGDIPEQDWILQEMRKYLQKAYVITAETEFNHAPVTEIASMPFDLMTLLTKGR